MFVTFFHRMIMVSEPKLFFRVVACILGPCVSGVHISLALSFDLQCRFGSYM
jgi:hypothetical protein